MTANVSNYSNQGGSQWVVEGTLKLPDNGVLHFGTLAGADGAGDLYMRWDGTDFDILPAANNSIIKIGNGTLSCDVWLYGSAAASYLSWDASANDLKLEDSVSLMFGTGAAAGPGSAGDVEMRWDGTDFDVLPLANNAVFKFGNGTLSFDLWAYGSAAASYVLWDASADTLSIEGTAGVLRVGNFASSYATGSASVLSATKTAVARFYGESVADATSAQNLRVMVSRHLVVTASGTINHESYGSISQLCVKNTSLGHYHGGAMGTYESNTAATVLTSYGVGAVIGRVGAENTTINAGGLLAGVLALENTTTVTATGIFAGFAVKTAAGKTDFTHALYVANAANVLAFPSGTAYEAGIKVAAITGVVSTCSGVVRIDVAGTPYYMPFYSAGELTGE